MDCLLQVRGLSVEYALASGGRGAAVRDVSFDLNSGGIMGLLGESGCGKSSLALAILGMLPPNGLASGAVLLNGRELLGLPERERCRVRGAQISYIPQESLVNLNPVMRVGTQIAEVLRAHESVSAAERRKQAQAALERAGLNASMFHAYPHQLSGGERQRVLIAQAIVCRPAVILADEPTAALDAGTQAEVLRMLANLVRESQGALLLISHQPTILAEFAQRVMVMYAGRIVEEGAAGDVLGNPFHPFTSGLLRCLRPAESATPRARLHTIPGAAPNPGDKSAGALSSRAANGGSTFAGPSAHLRSG